MGVGLFIRGGVMSRGWDGIKVWGIERYVKGRKSKR